jgi:hypothetical protein
MPACLEAHGLEPRFGMESLTEMQNDESESRTNVRSDLGNFMQEEI